VGRKASEDAQQVKFQVFCRYIPTFCLKEKWTEDELEALIEFVLFPTKRDTVNGQLPTQTEF